MKKTALFIGTALLAGMLFVTTHAYAAENKKFPAVGITLNFTPEFEETKGTVVPSGGVEIGIDTGIYLTDLIYVAHDQEEVDNLQEEDLADGSFAPLITIISADNGMTFDDVNKFAGGTLDPAAARPICTVGECTHFLYDIDESLPEGTDAVYLEEFSKLKNAVDAVIANSEFGKPTNPMESLIGRKVEFETTDTEGNPVKSEELFASHEITMVNIWASWCGYCIGEMEELEAINGRLAEKDCCVVGILSDGNKETALAAGKEILKEKGVTYTNILPPENLDDVFYADGYPTTYFVNREGIIVGTPISGARIDKYEPAVEAILSENESANEDPVSDSDQEETEETALEAQALEAHIETNDDTVYRIIVTNEDGDPVPEVAVQFCSDNTCKMGETDEAGTAVFQNEKGCYKVHILEAPEEYIVDETEFTLEEFCDLTIILSRK